MTLEKRIGKEIKEIEKKKLTEKIKDFRERLPMTEKIAEIIETYEDLSNARNEPVDSFILGYKFACDGILKLAKKYKDYYL